MCVQLEEGKLWFQLACSLGDGAGAGDSPDMLGISGRRINDGSWHTVALELNRNLSSLALDDSYVERRHGPPFIQPLAPDRTIYFGALVSPCVVVHVQVILTYNNTGTVKPSLSGLIQCCFFTRQ